MAGGTPGRPCRLEGTFEGASLAAVSRMGGQAGHSGCSQCEGLLGAGGDLGTGRRGRTGCSLLCPPPLEQQLSECLRVSTQ